MIIDAMDLLYTGRFSAFCLVSSDSDFTRLAARIREQGVLVYGFGNRHNTHKALVAACNQFMYFDALSGSFDGPSAPESGQSVSGAQISPRSSGIISLGPEPITPTGPKDVSHRPQSVPTGASRPSLPAPSMRTIDSTTKGKLRLAIQNNEGADGFANLANVGLSLLKISPDVNHRNYGYARLRDFVEASGLVESRTKSTERGPPIALVRLKDHHGMREPWRS